MMETKPNRDSRLIRTQPKNNKLRDQFTIVEEGFFKEPLTMKMLSVEVNIDRANICRYVRTLRRAGKIAVVKSGLCSITKHRANYLTTNPALFPVNKQTKLFD